MTSEKKGISKGCMLALIVAAVIVVILIAVAIFFYVYQDEILQFGLDKTVDIVVGELKTNIPEGVTEEEIDKLVFKFKEMLMEGQIESEDLDRFMATFERVMDDGQIDTQEASEFLEEIKRIVGKPDPTPVPN